MSQRILPVALVLLAALPGCYYFEAQDALGTAESAFESAKSQGFEKSDPYHYYAAEQYLERARIENKESDFGSARDFARKAQQRVQMAGVSQPSGSAPAAAAPATSSPDLEVTPVAPAPAAPSAGRAPELVVQPEAEPSGN